ncbi:heat-shock protein HslJ [Veronia pacifica]|uniref:Heat-shock protein HslJ n=2 Tax=Veronia pacifica TaxID=1080227 RepID=A0A1C3EPW4_9GAMM|nr:heat-shock protein HslJ [Veronia pacifica]
MNHSEKTASTATKEDMMDVSKTNLQHHHWVLTKINGEPVNSSEGFSAPTLEIGEAFTANGNGGCNRYFGQAELQDGMFRVQSMASTMMACPEQEMEIENIVTDTLSEWSRVTLTKNHIYLNGKASLEFRLQDWVY